MKLLKELGEETHANQMSLINDTDEIIKFLEEAGKKSILNEHTVNCRLTACNNLFSILNEGEHNVDYIKQNLELLVSRFRNKHTGVQASTLKVYKSRLKSSLEDFVCWSKDPLAWEKSVHEKAKAHHSHAKDKKKSEKVKAATQAPSAPTETVVAKETSRGGRRVSFPLRSDFNIEVTIPHDGISLKELLRLGLFLYPYCKDGDTRDVSTAWPMVPVSSRVAN